MEHPKSLFSNEQNQIFEEFLEFFNKNREYNEKSELYIQGQKLIKEFQEEYSLDKFRNLELDDYVVGKENNKSFCNVIEKGKYAIVGPGIGGNTAQKFGIYYSKKIQKYVSLNYKDGINNPEEYRNNMKDHLIDMMNSVKNAENVEDIRDETVYSDLKGMSLVLVKLAFSYNPDKLLAISGKTYLYDLFKLFNLEVSESINTSVKLSFQLNKVIREYIPELEDVESELLSRILWIFYQQRQNSQQRVWLLASGEKGEAWNEFKNENIIAINFEDRNLGSLNTYCSHKEIKNVIGSNKFNDSLAAWNFCSTMNIGDIVYVKRGTKTILGKGIIDGAYYYDEGKEKYNHRRSVKWISTEEKEIPADGIILPQKTLTDETGENVYTETLNSLYSNGESSIISNTYTKENFLDEVFMTSDEYDTINELLDRKKNIIFAGVPGVGKTFIAKKLIESRGNVAKTEIVQFHQSYSYEDFVQGYKPTEDGNFDLEDGVFYNLVMEARQAKRAEIDTGEPAKDYYIIIDEINRGNLSKIFGELLMLIESDKRNPKRGINLAYAKEEKDRDFYIPDNLYIIGTMNTADRSLTMIDYALRRRFAFLNLTPKFSTPEFKKYMSSRIDRDMVEKISDGYTKLNKFMLENLGKDFQIGHSYFIPQGFDIDNYGAVYKDIVEYEIKPLLEEYFYDDPNKVQEALNIINFDL